MFSNQVIQKKLTELDKIKKALVVLAEFQAHVERKHQLSSKKTQLTLLATATGLASLQVGINAAKSDTVLKKSILGGLTSAGILFTLFTTHRAYKSYRKPNDNLWAKGLSPIFHDKVKMIAKSFNLKIPANLPELNSLIAKLKIRQQNLQKEISNEQKKINSIRGFSPTLDLMMILANTQQVSTKKGL